MIAPEQAKLTNEQIIAHLDTLIETCKDGQQGFTCAAEDVQNSAFETLFSTYARQRGRFIKELEAEIRHLGGYGEKAEGSFTGALHRGWINLKAALSSREDLAILEECERGDRSAVESFQEVLANGDLGTVRPVLERQLAKISAAHQKVTALRDAREVGTK